MRRVALFLSVVSLLVFGFGFGVNAQSPRQPSPDSTELASGEAAGGVAGVEDELDRIAVMRAKLCSTTQLRKAINQSNIDAFGSCMIKLQTFSHETDDFLKKLFNCTSYAFLNQYGDDPNGGTFGYVWDPGNGVTFKTTAIDYVVDPTTEFFRNFYFVKDTPSCIAFMQ